MSDPALNYLLSLESDLARIDFNRAERPTQPPEPREVADDERLRARAAAIIGADAGHEDHWIALFDDTECEHVDLCRLALAMHRAHIGDDAGALRALREAAITTYENLVHEEHEELRRDCEDWREDR